jgi:hypothetical protein
MSAGQRIDRRQLSLVCWYSLRQSLRSGAGLVFVLLALFFGLTVAHLVISPFEALVAQGEQSGFVRDRTSVEQQVVSIARPAVEWVLSSRPVEDPEAQRAAEAKTREWVDFVLDERPALLSPILFVMLFGMPLLIPFGAFNQTSGDIGNRGFRYLLLRTDRANIYYGRLLATVLLTVAVQVIVVATIALYLGLKVQLYDGTAILSWSLQGLFALIAISLPYVAVCAWFSAANDSPMMSLVICNLAIGGVVLLSFIGARTWEPAYAINYLLPWGIQNRLLAPGAGTVALTAVGCVLYAAVFSWLGARKFQMRDL